MTSNQSLGAAGTSDSGRTDTLVELRGVSRAFGDLSVLQDVSFDIGAGTVACLVGPNGSGKTTLLRILAGLLAPDDGSVSVTADTDRAVGYLAQQPVFRPQFTVRETIEFYGTLVDGGTDVDPILDRVGLSPVAGRRVGALSGGMMRLLGVAQATVGDPSVLVLDEPSSGLDPMMTRHITDVIAELGRAGNAIILATHDLRSVERVADELLVLGRGELLVSAPPDVVLDETGESTLEAALDALAGGEQTGVQAGHHGGDAT